MLNGKEKQALRPDYGTLSSIDKHRYRKISVFQCSYYLKKKENIKKKLKAIIS